MSARIRRALREFLIVPGAVVAGYLALGVGCVLLDKGPPGWIRPVQHMLSRVISHDAATNLLSGIATSVVTVTSITFSVLLLAVQQTASSLTPAVFDQFLRRRTNQLYLGMFVGLSLFSFLVLASTGSKATPAIGASAALLLTAMALLALVVLIYSTVDQMRPSSVTQAIHDRALHSRERNLSILRRTRRVREGTGSVTVQVHAEQDGYVTSIDFDSVAAAIPEPSGTEVVLAVTLGQHIAFGQPLATVVDDHEATSERVAEQVRQAFTLDRSRDLDVDTPYAIDQLGNIGWSTMSTAKQNPEAGREAVDRLRDLGARWSAPDDAAAPEGSAVPIVYEDRDLAHLMDTLLALFVVSAESHQVSSAAYVAEALADVVAAAPEEPLTQFEGALLRTLGVVLTHPLTRPLDTALADLADTLQTRARHEPAARLRALHHTMSTQSHAVPPGQSGVSAK